VDQQIFEKAAEDTLERLNGLVSDALGEEADVAFKDGVLVIEFEDGQKFVVNMHRVAKQIWLAGFSSAWHFDPVLGADGTASRWTTPKGEELVPTVEALLTRKMSRPTSLAR
jgi:CyaY protein